jgi:hypothetical protein
MSKQYWAIGRKDWGIGETYIFEGSETEAKVEALKATNEFGFKFYAEEVEPYFGGWKYKYGDDIKGYTVDLTSSQG